jgi:hypothetical protein
LQYLFNNTPGIDLNDAEKIAIAHSVAAHTHYRREEDVKCADDVTRKVEPYLELDSDGNPIWSTWFPRWVDRLDCNGPCFMPRHYLTLAEEHKDFDGQVHFYVKFEHHMKPLLRPMPEQVDGSGNRNQTMSEHLAMFAGSQTNNSPYGKHDFGAMVELRDSYRARLERIINSTQTHTTIIGEQEARLRKDWVKFLGANIEPSVLGQATAKTLDSMFAQLPDTSRTAWLNAFATTMGEYLEWAGEKLKQLDALSFQDVYSIPTVTDNVKEVLEPVVK